MPQIDQASQLAALIRAQIGAQARAKERHEAGAVRPPSCEAMGRMAGDSATSGQVGRGPANPQPSAALQQLVAMRVRGLSPDDPQRPRKAFRIFLESMLAQEFGHPSATDPSFARLVDQVLGQMESDAGLNAALLEAGSMLVNEVQPGKRPSPVRGAS